MPQQITPIYDPNRGWRQWSSEEIYTGPNGTGRYVPNIDDLIWDKTSGWYVVVSINTTSYESTLQIWEPTTNPDDVAQEDVFLGTGPGRTSESFRAYIDTSVLPHRMALSSRLRSYGTTVSYVKVFRGVVINDNGEVISAWYDQSGDLVGENIPMELVAMTGNNTAVKTARVGWCRVPLDEGEQVTVVAYDDNGVVRDTAVLLVRNTNFIRTTEASAKYVVSIGLESPFISAGDSELLQYPINLPLSSANLMGVVTYSNGDKVRMPVDGSKFAMLGMNNYIATIPGQRVPLVLRYLLSSGEYSYDLAQGADPSIMNRSYWVESAPVSGAYAVKLFTFPKWDDSNNKYRLDHFLYNLERQQVWNVTPYVEVVSDPFDGRDLGTEQQLVLALDLSRASGTFNAYRHVQTIGVTLIQDGNGGGDTFYRIESSPGQSVLYGDGVYASASNSQQAGWTYDLSGNATTKEEWVQSLYRNMWPLHYTGSEAEAPEPNFARLVYGSTSVEISVDDWDQPIQIAGDPVQLRQIYVEFIKRGPGGDLQLGKAALPVRTI